MPGRQRRSLAEDLAETTPVDTLVQALGKLTHRSTFKAPSYSGEGEVELFLEQFQDVALANEWSEHATLLHLRSSLTGAAMNYGRGNTPVEIFAALRARYGTSVRQAKERLLSLKRGSSQPIPDLALEIKGLVGLAHPTMSEREREQMAIDHLIRSLDNKALQRHLLTADTSTLAQAQVAIEEYLSVGGTDRAVVRTVEETEPTTQLVDLTKAMVTQSEILSKVMSRLESLEQAATRNEAASIPREVVAMPPRAIQSGQARGQFQTVFRPQGCFQCGGPHFKRDCPARPAGQFQGQTYQGQGNGGRPVM